MTLPITLPAQCEFHTSSPSTTASVGAGETGATRTASVARLRPPACTVGEHALGIVSIGRDRLARLREITIARSGSVPNCLVPRGKQL
jgi:hypothetical protein